jgi:hypothetical protein
MVCNGFQRGESSDVGVLGFSPLQKIQPNRTLEISRIHSISFLFFFEVIELQLFLKQNEGR